MRIRAHVAIGVFFVAQVCALRCTPVIVVPGKFASILIRGLNSSCVAHPPQSVLRFCVFSGQRFRVRDFGPRTQTVFLWSGIVRVQVDLSKEKKSHRHF